MGTRKREGRRNEWRNGDRREGEWRRIKEGGMEGGRNERRNGVTVEGGRKGEMEIGKRV